MTTVQCACLEADRTARLRQDELLRPLLPALLPWLVGRRWFSHERGCLQSLRPIGSTTLTRAGAGGDGPVLLHLVAEAEHGDGAAHRYQILVGLRRNLATTLSETPFGRASGGAYDGWWLYEATCDPELMALLLAETAAGRAGDGLRLTLTPGSRITPGLTPRLLAVEQSNTAVAFGEELLLKIFRQPQPGRHPETEVLAALTGAGSTQTPRLTGWLSDADPRPGESADETTETTVLGIVEEFLRALGDGWELAVRHAADCLVGRTAGAGDPSGLSGFTDQARALGASVASMHASLAKAFPTTRLDAEQILAQVSDMQARLAAATDWVTDLEGSTTRILMAYDEFARVALAGCGLQGQRAHGDLHLGQVLRTEDGWRVIDFEGEPSRPVEERGLPQSPLRDVAGMLRSFDYAAQHALREVTGDLQDPLHAAELLRYSRCAQAWAIRNRRAFVDGYAKAGGIDPRCHPVAMRAFELDKAVYEAHYEAEHRPDWLPVPLTAIRRVLSHHRGSAA